MSHREIINGKSYVRWEYAGGPNECHHGYAEGIQCPCCDAEQAVFPEANSEPDKEQTK